MKTLRNHLYTFRNTSILMQVDSNELEVKVKEGLSEGHSGILDMDIGGSLKST